MFVYEYQIVIKTCGTTTLLACLDKLLEIAASVGLKKVDDVFYNRQNFFFPEKQLEPHQSFKSECRILDQYFSNGGAYMVGRLNENHYNFYNAECKMNRQDPAMLERDNTLEVLMSGLDPERMKLFYYKEGVSNEEIRKISGISDFFPNATIDDYMFQPFGYSLNALLPDGYFTIHITPQPNCSFVSFETNAPLDDYTELILKVLRAFRPERFIVTHMANTLATNYIKLNSDNYRGFNANEIAQAGGFRATDDILCHFEHYDLFFLQYKASGTSPTRTDDEVVGEDKLPKKRRFEPEGSILKAAHPTLASTSSSGATALVVGGKPKATAQDASTSTGDDSTDDSSVGSAVPPSKRVKSATVESNEME